MTDEYFAGFFDGEGCIHISSNREGRHHTLVLQVSQVDRRPLTALVDRFGGTVCPLRPVLDGRHAIFQWTVRSKAAEAALEALLPFLVVKKEQAELALEYRRSITSQMGSRRVPAEELALRESYRLLLQEMKRP